MILYSERIVEGRIHVVASVFRDSASSVAHYVEHLINIRSMYEFGVPVASI